MSDPARDTPELLFRPDSFFLRPWKGWGVMRDALGRPQLRYEAQGRGRSGTRAATAEQVFTFENGLVHRVEWEIVSEDERRYFARDLCSGIEARGETSGPDFRWRFHARGATPFGQQRVKTEALYTLATPTAAISFTRVSWLGLQLSTFTTFYEQV
jgi:Protein of unknown function (DUF3833)